MPIIVKNSITQFASTGCKKQLRLSMHPVSKKYQPERDVMDLPHEQVRPALVEIRRAGDEWGYAKVQDLADAFGADALVGGARHSTGGTIGGGLRFEESNLAEHLDTVTAGHFLIETQFPVDTPTFRTAHGLHTVVTDTIRAPLDVADARPDIIEVLDAGTGATVAVDGSIAAPDPTDGRLLLRIIDVKLTSEPGAQYFAELAYYCLALAAWLHDSGRADRFAVSADPGIWPGSETVSPLEEAVANQRPVSARAAALHTAIETAPTRIFLSEVLRVLRTIIPEVLRTPLDELPWAVTPGCQGCEHLGQKFAIEPGTNASAWDPRHCLPTAERTQHLSRLPFLSRGATQVLRNHGIESVTDVAELESADPTFDEHHRLRGQRTIVGSRARSLTGTATPPIPHPAASTVAVPGFTNLQIFISADFDPGSALTLVFGLHWGWGHRDRTTLPARGPRIHVTDGKSIEAEWEALQLLLDDIDGLLTDATRLDPNATMQVFVWDSITFDHLTRVIGRHLGQVLREDRLARLAWLFPPEQVLDAEQLASAPAVSVVRDAVTTLLSLDLPHTYTLVDTARLFHSDSLQNSTFFIPPFWFDPFSDQIPPERAHQVWRRDSSRNVPTPASLRADLHTTVKTKLFALGTVTREIQNQLSGRLPRRPPKIRQIRGPEPEPATSDFGVLLLAHARLDQALQELDTSRLRSLPLEEREARFESARLTRQLHGAERNALLDSFGIDQADAAVAVFELPATSAQVHAKENDFSWAVLPVEHAHRIKDTFWSYLWSAQNPELSAQWDDNYSALNRTLDSIFAVTLLRLDRVHHRLVVRFETWRESAQQRQALIGAGAIQLEENLVLDPRTIDVFTKRLQKVVRAIGFPPVAQQSAPVQQALGFSRRRPRATATIAAGDYLWAAADAAATELDAPIETLRSGLLRAGIALNPSQEVAWQHALQHRLSLIWGPPGTGKTATVHAILASLAELSSDAPLRIAVTANNYTAVDNVLRGLRPYLDELAPNTIIRRVRAAGRVDVDWLTADENVSTSDTRAVRSIVDDLLEHRTAIVGGTPTQLHKLIESATGAAAGDFFDVIVIDEGGQIDVAHASVVLAGAATNGRVIIAGDPRQLPPIHTAEAPAGLESLVGSIYDFFADWHKVAAQPLLTNYRSNQDIVNLTRSAGYPPELTAHDPNRRYRLSAAGQGLLTARSPIQVADTQIPVALFDVIDPERPVTCLTYADGVSGQWNRFEADIVAQTCILLWRLTEDEQCDAESFWTRRVGIVTPHRAQRAMVIERLTSIFATGSNADQMRRWIADAVDTVERFQGQERDVILASFAVGDPDTVTEEAEFLHSLNRFNVLTTRAQTKLIVIASREVFDHLDGDLEVLRSSQLIKDFVDVYCNVGQTITLHRNDDGAPEHVPVELRWHVEDTAP